MKPWNRLKVEIRINAQTYLTVNRKANPLKCISFVSIFLKFKSMKSFHLYLLTLAITFCTLISCKKDKDSEPVTPVITDPALAPFSAQNALLLDSIISNVLLGNAIPGIVVGVRSSTLGTYKKAFGVSNYVTQAPMNVNAIFDIGSVHKNFKWVILHILEKEGVLNLNDLVNSYVSEPVLPGVTLKHLMQHSSGLCDIPDISDFNTNVWNNPTFENSYDTMMYYLNHATGTNSYGNFTNGKLANFAVGVNSSYSSFGPLIAAEVVKNITGKNIRQLINEKIIVPLGLTATSHMAFEPDPALLTPGHADSVTLSPFTPTAQSTMGLSSANGGAIHTDVSDLLTFTHNEFTNTNFLSAQTVENMRQDNLVGFGMKAGLGIIQFNQWAPSNFWGHAGFGIRSHSTTQFHNKDHNLTIVVFTNIYTPRDDFQTNYAISEAILNALY